MMGLYQLMRNNKAAATPLSTPRCPVLADRQQSVTLDIYKIYSSILLFIFLYILFRLLRYIYYYFPLSNDHTVEFIYIKQDDMMQTLINEMIMSNIFAPLPSDS